MLMQERVFFSALVFCAVFEAAGLAPFARADTTYTYTGNPFTAFFALDTTAPACPPTCMITGSFTVAQPLAANLSSYSFTPEAFSFTDGNIPITNLTSGLTQTLFDGFSTNS